MQNRRANQANQLTHPGNGKPPSINNTYHLNSYNQGMNPNVGGSPGYMNSSGSNTGNRYSKGPSMHANIPSTTPPNSNKRGNAALPGQNSNYTFNFSNNRSTSSQHTSTMMSSMNGLIPIVNKLQDVFSVIGKQPIDLPQIVVIGSQSSGKSSVLEHIVGRDFLPRGTGIVTRRPLVLQLYNTNYLDNGASRGPESYEDDANNLASDVDSISVNSRNMSENHYGQEEWGEFLHIPNQKFYNFEEICEEIRRDTEKVTGHNKGISNKQILLKIYSPHVLNLTLVDLPGMTKVSVGDQPKNIENQIRDMCLNYISNPKSIILAVSPANTDIANSDALKLAREVDPQGIRTIGVLTKVDLMDEGTNICDVLSNSIVPLEYGYVAVISRGQKDIENRVPIREALKKEAHFFEKKIEYRNMLDRTSTRVLTRILNQILMEHIRKCLPDLKATLSTMMLDVKKETDALGQPIAYNPSNVGAVLLTMLSKFADIFKQAIDGTAITSTGSELTELYGGARIHYILNHIFSKTVTEMDTFENLTDEEIRTIISNANGTRPALFVSELSFDLLVRRQITRLEQAGLECVDLVFEELLRLVTHCEVAELARFPNLKDRAVEVVGNMLRKCVAPTQSMIKNLIAIELAYINTAHPDFIGGSKASAILFERSAKSGNRSGYNNSLANNVVEHDSADNNLNFSDADSGRLGTNSPSVENDNTISPSNKTASPNPQHRAWVNMIFDRNNSSNASQKSLAGNTNTKNEKMLPPSVSTGNSNTLGTVPRVMKQSSNFTEKERREMDLIKLLTESYFNIVRKTFLDMVPKTIMCFLVNHAKDNLQNELVSNLYRDDLVRELLKEPEEIASRRQNNMEMGKLLSKAMEIVSEVKDLNSLY